MPIAADELILAIYEAVVDPKVVPVLLGHLATRLDATAAALIQGVSPGEDPLRGSVSDLDDGADSSWLDHLSRFREWREAVSLLPTGAVVSWESILPGSVLRQSEFVREWMRPRELRWAMNAIVSSHREGRSAVLLLRRDREGPYRDGHRAHMERLLPHLQRAARIARSLDDLRRAPRVASAILDRVGLAAIAVDASGRIRWTNGAADALLAGNEILARHRDGLRAIRPEDQQALRALIERAVRPDGPPAEPRASLVTFPRPSGGRDLAVTALPFGAGPGPSLGDAPPGALLVASGPEAGAGVSPTRLQRLYGLTPAEARVLLSLLKGATLSETASLLTLSEHTVRNELKRVFLKTGTRRQSALLRLVLSDLIHLQP